MPADLDTSGEQQPDFIANLAEALRDRFNRSWYKELENRILFPFYPAPCTDAPIAFKAIHRPASPDEIPLREAIAKQLGEQGSLEEWWLFPDREVIASLYSPNPIDGTDEVSLFEAAIMIGERIRGDASRLLFKMSDVYVEALLAGELNPRHPVTGIKFGDPKATGLGLPDLYWRLYPEELQAFALKTWGLPVYTEDELRGERALPVAEPSEGNSASEPPVHRSESQEKATQRALGTTERNSLLVIIATLCRAHVGIDHQAHGAAARISKMTENSGVPVSPDTVKRVLSIIPNALESRTK